MNVVRDYGKLLGLELLDLVVRMKVIDTIDGNNLDLLIAEIEKTLESLKTMKKGI